MHVDNTSTRAMYVSVDGNEVVSLQSGDTHLFTTEGGSAEIQVGVERGSMTWRGHVPTDDIPILLTYADSIKVLYGDTIMPNCIASTFNWFIVAVLILALMLFIVSKLT